MIHMHMNVKSLPMYAGVKMHSAINLSTYVGFLSVSHIQNHCVQLINLRALLPMSLNTDFQKIIIQLNRETSHKLNGNHNNFILVNIKQIFSLISLVNQELKLNTKSIWKQTGRNWFKKIRSHNISTKVYKMKKRPKD